MGTLQTLIGVFVQIVCLCGSVHACHLCQPDGESLWLFCVHNPNLSVPLIFTLSQSNHRQSRYLGEGQEESLYLTLFLITLLQSDQEKNPNSQFSSAIPLALCYCLNTFQTHNSYAVKLCTVITEINPCFSICNLIKFTWIKNVRLRVHLGMSLCVSAYKIN